MASDSATPTTENGTTDSVLQTLIRGKRGEALRAQLVARYPDSPADAIEEAIQSTKAAANSSITARRST